MNKRIFILSLIFFPFFVLLAWIGLLEFRYVSSPRVLIAVSGHDPRDFLSGHYLSLQPDWIHTDCRQFVNGLCPKERFEKTYRYYMTQSDARQIELALSDSRLDMKLEFALPEDGSPLIRKLIINKMDWQEWLKK